MLKKSILVGLFLSGSLLGTAFCHEYSPTAMTAQPAQQNGRVQDAQSALFAAQTPVLLDRSGMDKASVHLQILQQTNNHFSDTAQAKKPSPDDRKSPVKAQIAS
jgi:hypothetical protein